jgi:hypothetical protein
LERPRPLSAESLEGPEVLPLAADVPVPSEDTPPLIPVKGTLKRSAHTSMRNARRGGVRAARRVSEPKKDLQNQPSITEDLPAIHERSESMPLLTRALSNPENQQQTSSADRTSAPPELGNVELYNLVSPVPEIRQSPDPIIEDENAVLGQVQPRHLRRPPLRRQTIEAPETLSSSSQPPLSPTKERVPPKRSPVSPTFSSPIPSSPIEERQSTSPQNPAVQSTPPCPTYDAPLPPLPGAPQTAPTISKKGSWKSLFTSSSEDDLSSGSKEKHSKVKIKKAVSLSEPPKPTEAKLEPQVSFELDRGPTFADVAPAPTPLSPSVSPVAPPAPPKQSGKKESGLFASLFGSKKKSQESKEKQSKNQESEASKTKSGQASNQRPGGWTNQGHQAVGPPVLNYYYTRFPIHVERAIYRLSHIKLANPRRPLLQQVLLSNFMYGYLNLINKTAQPRAQQEIPQSEAQQISPQGAYEESSQPEEHVYYSGEEQPDYYGQDYYGAEYDDDPDDVSACFQTSD